MDPIENNNSVSQKHITTSNRNNFSGKILSVHSEADNTPLTKDQQNSILGGSVPEETGFSAWGTENADKSDSYWKNFAIGAGIVVSVTAAALLLTKSSAGKKLAKYTLTKGKTLLKKIPYRLKSPLHQDFCSTGDQLYIRLVQESKKKGLSLEEMVHRIYRKETIAQNGIDAVKKDCQEFLTKVEQYITKHDNSFKNIIPSPLRHTYYRGLSGENYGTKIINEAKVGDIIAPDLGYCFASLKKEVAMDYSNLYCNSKVKDPLRQCVMKIITPSGSIVSRNYSHLSEVVFPREAQYKVLKKEIIDGRTFITLKYLQRT